MYTRVHYIQLHRHIYRHMLPYARPDLRRLCEIGFSAVAARRLGFSKKGLSRGGLVDDIATLCLFCIF